MLHVDDQAGGCGLGLHEGDGDHLVQDDRTTYRSASACRGTWRAHDARAVSAHRLGVLYEKEIEKDAPSTTYESCTALSAEQRGRARKIRGRASRRHYRRQASFILERRRVETSDVALVSSHKTQTRDKRVINRLAQALSRAHRATHGSSADSDLTRNHQWDEARKLSR